MKNSDIRSDEQQMIIKALESLSTSYTNERLMLSLKNIMRSLKRRVDRRYSGILALQKKMNRYSG